MASEGDQAEGKQRAFAMASSTSGWEAPMETSDGWAAPMDAQGSRERHAAAAWIASHLKPAQAEVMIGALETVLEQRHDGHWYPEEPHRGSAYRSIACSSTSLDPLLAKAALQASVAPRELHQQLCRHFVQGCTLYLWINPGEVKALIERPQTPKKTERICGEPASPYSRSLRLKIVKTKSWTETMPEIDSDTASCISDSASDMFSDC